RAAARAVAGNHRLRARHLGPVAGGHSRAPPGRGASPRSLHDSGRRPLRPHRATARDGAGHPGLCELVMRLRHGRISLELHELAQRHGPPLLLLHALFASSDDWGEAPALWPGPVYALDFSGHGRSDWITGGSYYPEQLAGDADAALQHLGRAAVA